MPWDSCDSWLWTFLGNITLLVYFFLSFLEVDNENTSRIYIGSGIQTSKYIAPALYSIHVHVLYSNQIFNPNKHTLC